MIFGGPCGLRHNTPPPAHLKAFLKGFLNCNSLYQMTCRWARCGFRKNYLFWNTMASGEGLVTAFLHVELSVCVMRNESKVLQKLKTLWTKLTGDLYGWLAGRYLRFIIFKSNSAWFRIRNYVSFKIFMPSENKFYISKACPSRSGLNASFYKVSSRVINQALHSHSYIQILHFNIHNANACGMQHCLNSNLILYFYIWSLTAGWLGEDGFHGGFH